MHPPPFIRRYSAAAILIVVACTHLYQNRTMNRSAWGAGCGFGMFSTVEHHGTRRVRCLVTTDAGQRVLEIPAHDSLRVRAMPTDANLAKLAEAALHEATKRWPTTSAIQLEVWRTRFHLATKELSYSRFATVTRKTANANHRPPFNALAMPSRSRSHVIDALKREPTQ